LDKEGNEWDCAAAIRFLPSDGARCAVLPVDAGATVARSPVGLDSSMYKISATREEA